MGAHIQYFNKGEKENEKKRALKGDHNDHEVTLSGKFHVHYALCMCIRLTWF